MHHARVTNSHNDKDSDYIQHDQISFIAEEMDELLNFNTYSCDPDTIDKCLIYYQWLADMGITSHIANTKKAFMTLKPLQNTIIKGVGGAKAQAEGRGTIKLESYVNEHIHILRLEDILYVPTNPHNLLSLGYWDNSGGRYQGGNGCLLLITKDRHTVAKGKKIQNNLYKMNLSIRKSKKNGAYNKNNRCSII
jgi:hypothetical protein